MRLHFIINNQDMLVLDPACCLATRHFHIFSLFVMVCPENQCLYLCGIIIVMWPNWNIWLVTPSLFILNIVSRVRGDPFRSHTQQLDLLKIWKFPTYRHITHTSDLPTEMIEVFGPSIFVLNSSNHVMYLPESFSIPVQYPVSRPVPRPPHWNLNSTFTRNQLLLIWMRYWYSLHFTSRSRETGGRCLETDIRTLNTEEIWGQRPTAACWTHRAPI